MAPPLPAFDHPHLPLGEDRGSSGIQEPLPASRFVPLYLFLCVRPPPLDVGLHRPPDTPARVCTPHTHPPLLGTPEDVAQQMQSGLFLRSRVCSWGPARPLSVTLTSDLTIFSLVPSSSFPAPSLLNTL